MKKTKSNIEHRIQLKKIEIENYEQAIDHFENCGGPYLQKLNNELKILENELEDRESKREIVRNLGYARIGLRNI